MSARGLFVVGAIGLAGVLALPGAAPALGIPIPSLAPIGAGPLSVAQVNTLARRTVQLYAPGVDPLMVRAMVEIESARDPRAERDEPQIGDASIGLMQTLEGTAQWLWDDIGDRQFSRPTRSSLFKPSTSLYFGARYIAWLQQFRPGASEEWIVRAYNGGPGGATSSATRAHWERYQRAKARLIAGAS